MNALRLIGVILIVLGAIALIYGGITYTTNKDVVDFGPVKVQAEQKHSIPLPPLLGGAAVVLGIFMLLAGRRGSSGRAV